MFGPRAGHVFATSFRSDSVLWVHENASWKYYTAKDHPALGAFTKLFPLSDGSLKVEVQPGYDVVVALADRASSGNTALKPRNALRDARNERFAVPPWDKSRLADFTREELAAYGKFLTEDAEGRIYYWAQPLPDAIHIGHVVVFDPRHPEDAPTLRYDCFPLDAYHRAARFDSEQRLWARLSVNAHPFLSRFGGNGWTHFPDPTGWTPDRFPNCALIHRDGEFWAMLAAYAAQGRGSLDGATAPEVPGMANPAFLQRLRQGGMVASETGMHRAFLFDGQQWTAFDSLRVMVEKQYGWLKEHIDNTAVPFLRNDFALSLGCDHTGLVWLTENNFSKAFDGKQWKAIPFGRFRMNASGSRVAGGNTRPVPNPVGILYDSSVWPPKPLTALTGKIGDDFENHPLLKDTAGRVWSRQRNGWQVALSDGRTGELLLHHSVAMNAPIVEQGGGVFWAFAADGLLQMHVEESKAKAPKIILDQHYPRLIPQGEIQLLGLDRNNNLWMVTQYGKSGLYRIKLPPTKRVKS